MEEVDCDFSLREELISQEFRECGGHACKNGEKVGFKSLDCAFRCVATVHVWGNELEGCVPFFLDLKFAGGAAFVVEDLEVDVVTIFLEAGHDAVGDGGRGGIIRLRLG